MEVNLNLGYISSKNSVPRSSKVAQGRKIQENVKLKSFSKAWNVQLVVRRLRRFLLHYIKFAWKAILIPVAKKKQKDSFFSADSPKYGFRRPGQNFLKPVTRVTSRIRNRDKVYPIIWMKKVTKWRALTVYNIVIIYNLKVYRSI